MRKWLPLLAVCLGTFMLLVDVTIVNVALPDMAKDLSTSFSSLQWVVDAYALALAALVLGAGSIADLLGHRRTYVAGLALFAVASAVCGFAPNSGVLIASRTVQGVGAAIMFATTFALLNSNYSGRDRGTAYGMWGAVSGASAAIGPIIGGFLTEGISWRWIFFVNLPVSAVAIAMCLKVLVDAHAPHKSRVDVWGIVTFTASAAALTYGFIYASEHAWGSTTTVGLLLAGAVLLAAFVGVELRTPHAMLDLGLLRTRSFVGVIVAALLINFSAFAYLTYTSIWLQSVIGLSPIQAGLTGLPLSGGAFIAAALIGRVLHRAAPGPIIGTGMVLVGVGALLAIALVRGDASWPALIAGYVVVGVGVGLATPTLSSAGMSAVPVQRGGMAAGAVNTARQLGYAFGIALLGSVFSIRAQSTLSDHGVARANDVSHALAGGQAGRLLGAAPASERASLDHVLHLASISGLQGTFLVAGIGGVVAGLLVFALVRPARSAAAAEPGSDAAGSDAAGSDAADSGVAGSGVAGSGAAGADAAGSGVAGSGVAGSGVAGAAGALGDTGKDSGAALPAGSL